MKKTKEPRKDVNQNAKQAVDLSIERLNKAADASQLKKGKEKPKK